MSSLFGIRRRSLLVGAMVAVVPGCGSGGNDGPHGLADPVFTSLSLTASATTIFTRPPGTTATLTARALDQHGQVMTGLGSPSFTSDNPGIASVDASGMVTAVVSGFATIRASLTANGVTKTALIAITVTDGDMEATVIAPAVAFQPDAVDIARGGTVTWTFQGVAHTVVFTTEGAPEDLPEPWLAGSQSRTFPDSGTFHYDCTVHAGMSGQVIVH